MPVFLLLLGCPHPATGRAADASEGCPTADFDPPVCQDPARGSTPALPLEIGDAGRSVLWFNRVACADGGEPQVVRNGSLGEAPTPTASPRNPATNWFGNDTLDEWTVFCRGAPEVTLYVDLYRCGDVCVPPSIQVLPHALDVEFAAAQAAEKAGDLAAASAHGKRLMAIGDAFEWAWSMGAMIAADAGDPDALAKTDELIRRWDKPLRRLNRVQLLVGLGSYDEARASLDAFTKANSDPSLDAKRMCIEAEIAPDATASAALAKQSCAAGFDPCCAPGGVYRLAR